jgi:methylglutaconyl-CoA hydratase
MRFSSMNHPMSNTLNLSIERGIATLQLNRPDVHNAFDDQLIAALTQALQQLDQDSTVRAVVLTAAGASFSAGADLNWMRGMASASEVDNYADSLRLAELMRTLAFLSKPTLAKVNGAAYGGGVGLVACCDIAIAADTAKFGLTETKLGLVPAVISPYVIRAIGERQAMRLFLTAAIFDAEHARTIGLVHNTVAAAQLDAVVRAELDLLLKAGPHAVREAKALVHRDRGFVSSTQEKIDANNAALIARLRISDEGQEGLGAFLGKRKAAWISS